MESDGLDLLKSILETERTCALATPTDLWPIHASTMHYSYNLSPLEIFFGTDITTLKCDKLRAGDEVKAGLAVRASEQTWLTAQMHGVLNFAEAAPAKAIWIFPFQNSPFPVFKNVLHDAGHFGLGKLRSKHLNDGVLSFYRCICNLMIYRLIYVEFTDCIGISCIKGLNPSRHQFLWSHILIHFRSTS
ncbi:hypothetical protein RA27_00590 [Ruegeria sp. ANG-R]|nr:hypothetical protein RA27_00590 [Ruegeria sp. ANG-R]